MSASYPHPKTGTRVLRLDGHALRMESCHTRVDHSYWGVRAWCDCGAKYGDGISKREAQQEHHHHLRIVLVEAWEKSAEGQAFLAKLDRDYGYVLPAESGTRRTETVRVREGIL